MLVKKNKLEKEGMCYAKSSKKLWILQQHSILLHNSLCTSAHHLSLTVDKENWRIIWFKLLITITYKNKDNDDDYDYNDDENNNNYDDDHHHDDDNPRENSNDTNNNNNGDFLFKYDATSDGNNDTSRNSKHADEGSGFSATTKKDNNTIIFIFNDVKGKMGKNISNTNTIVANMIKNLHEAVTEKNNRCNSRCRFIC